MAIDRAGNRIGRAKAIALAEVNRSYQDWVGKGDRDDFYQFRLHQRSSVQLSLSGLQANADLALLSGSKVVRRSLRSGRQAETIRETLPAGTYYVRVNQQTGNTRYTLSTIAVPVRPMPAERPFSPVQNVPLGVSADLPATFDIQFDYRFDTAGWFTPERRAVLETAASFWENVIRSEFDNVPAGTMLNLIHPVTRKPVQFPMETEIDDLVVFVGAGNMDGLGRMLAESGPSGYFIPGNGLEKRYQGDRFQPWAGSLTFDSADRWFADPTPETANDIPAGFNDILAVVTHELGHVLGISTSDVFDNLITNGKFMGPKARAINGGQPVPMSHDGHIEDSFIGVGDRTESLMDPTLMMGSRKMPTNLDIALLEDIGYQVVYKS